MRLWINLRLVFFPPRFIKHFSTRDFYFYLTFIQDHTPKQKIGYYTNGILIQFRNLFPSERDLGFLIFDCGLGGVD